MTVASSCSTRFQASAFHVCRPAARVLHALCRWRHSSAVSQSWPRARASDHHICAGAPPPVAPPAAETIVCLRKQLRAAIVRLWCVARADLTPSSPAQCTRLSFARARGSASCAFSPHLEGAPALPKLAAPTRVRAPLTRPACPPALAGARPPPTSSRASEPSQMCWRQQPDFVPSLRPLWRLSGRGCRSAWRSDGRPACRADQPASRESRLHRIRAEIDCVCARKKVEQRKMLRRGRGNQVIPAVWSCAHGLCVTCEDTRVDHDAECERCGSPEPD